MVNFYILSKLLYSILVRRKIKYLSKIDHVLLKIWREIYIFFKKPRSIIYFLLFQGTREIKKSIKSNFGRELISRWIYFFFVHNTLWEKFTFWINQKNVLVPKCHSAFSIFILISFFKTFVMFNYFERLH